MYIPFEYINRGMLFLHNKNFRSRKKLATLMFYATDLCDSRCKHCYIWDKRPVKFMSKDKIVELMHSDCVTKHTTIGLEGGEFLLHPEANDIMAWLQKHHPKYDLLSNCLKPENTIEASRKYTPKRLYISLDGREETYEYMRGKKGYPRVLSVIKELKNEVPISVMFTITPFNSDVEDLQHVAEVCKEYNIDLRVGIYNNIAFFDTAEIAHKTQDAYVIPEIVKDFKENYDFLILYNEWKSGNLKMPCNSILDSLVILPNGDVPICQNLDTMLGNVYENSLDEVFNSTETQELHHDHQYNCNKCWVNFHRKYDVAIYRSFESFFPKSVISKMFGYYQWTGDAKVSYDQFMKSHNGTL
jgi:MoaA/NifB/PqqE/SkfB family radical SAM enzyme